MRTVCKCFTFFYYYALLLLLNIIIILQTQVETPFVAQFALIRKFSY